MENSDSGGGARMKKMLLFSLMILCLPAIARAQAETALMGLYFDEARTIHCADRGAYQPIEVWMWCNAPSIELKTLSFRLIYSENALGATVTYNPNIMSISGTPGSSVDLGFSDCQTDWFWAFHQTIYPMNANAAMIQLAPYSTSMYPPLRFDSLRVLDCSSSPVPAVRISSACLNSCVTDYAPPVIEHVNYVTKTQLEVVFSEAVDPLSAQAASSYTVAQRLDGLGGIAVANADLQGDGVTVLVDLAASLLDNVPYILRSVGVADLLGNAWVSYGEFGNGPDLVVSYVDAPDTIADCGTVIPCSVTVANIGSFAATAFAADAKLQYLDENGTWQPTNLYPSDYLYCAGLLPGETCSFDFDFTVWWSYRFVYASRLRSSMRIVISVRLGDRDVNERNNVGIAPVTLLYPIPFFDFESYDEGTDAFTLEFRRSLFDDPAYSDPVTSYEVYRRSLEGTATELAATVPATGSQTYFCEIPRLPDREFVYLSVRALRPGAGGTTSYSSCEVLMEAPFAPTMPRNLTATGTVNGIVLSWLKSIEPDVLYYYIYRGTTPDFVANIDSRLDCEYSECYSYGWPDTTFRDYQWHPGTGFYYKVSAVDGRRRESECALIVGDDVVATELQSFSAMLRGEAVKIAWSLAEGCGAKEFAVMRKAGESGVYETLAGFVERESDGSFKYLDESAVPGSSYRYCVAAIDSGAQRILFETEAVTVPPRVLALMQNHPNPFNPSTTIEYSLPESGYVSLTVFDVSGRRVARLVDGKQEQGPHTVQWTGRDQNGRAVASGIYFYKLEFGKESLTRKMVFLR